MKVVYVAGRFRGPSAWAIAENVRRAEAAGLNVAELGAMPLIPHANTALFHGLLTDRFWIEGTQELLRRADAVFVFNINDLDTSEGTRGEVDLAREIGKPVFFDLDDLDDWLRLQEGTTT